MIEGIQDVPEEIAHLLRARRHSSKPDWDLGELPWSRHGVKPAAIAALPFLVKVMAVLSSEHRAALLDMIERVADDGDNAEQVDRGWHAAWSEAKPKSENLFRD